MVNKLLLLLFIFAITLIGWSYFYVNRIQFPQPAQIVNALQNDSFAQVNLLPISSSKLIEPVYEFKERIIKKPFGIYITPETSPVQPDKFTGYHAGVDAEFDDVLEDIPVLAIADGTILVRAHVPGYGGVVVIRHIIRGVSILALYGHLDSASFLPAAISQVTAGSQIGILGDGHSEETDGARKHLHFSLYPDRGDEKTSPELSRRIDFRGYVKTEEELANWLNPLDFYR